MKTQTTFLEKMGAAHLLPGLTRAIECLMRERDEIVRMIGEDLEHSLSLEPRAAKSKGSGTREYWAKRTPKQRSAEMKRRYNVHLAKVANAETPAKAIPAKHTRPRRSWWDSLTPEQKAAHAKKQSAGLKKAFAAKKKEAKAAA